MQGNRGKKVIFAAMLIALCLRLPLAWKAPEVLIPKVVSDDMFYYLDIARNIAHGHGATTDGENVSNGFHVLFAALLVPLAKISGGDRGLFVHLALSLLTVFSVLSAWPLYRLLRVCASEASALVVSVLWLCAPFSVLITLSGTEVPVYVFVLGLLCLAYVKMKAAEERSLTLWFLLGLLAALTVLARLDGAVLAAIICVELFLTLRRRTSALAFGAGTAAGTFPWFLWSYLRTGFILQVSGKAIRHQQHVVFHLTGGGAASWVRHVTSNARTGIESMTFMYGVSGVPLAALCAVLLVVLAVFAAVRKNVFREWLRRSRPLFFIPVYGIVILALYSGWLWYTQNWYYYSVFFSGLVLLGCVLSLFESGFSRSRSAARRAAVWGGLVALIVAFSCYKNVRWWEHGLRGWQTDGYRAAMWARDNLARETRLASFNSGVLSYYCPQVVINLDGVVNVDAYRALTGGRIFSYVRDQQIDYIIDTPASLRFRSAQSRGEPALRLTPVHAEFSYPEAIARKNPVTVYRVER